MIIDEKIIYNIVEKAKKYDKLILFPNINKEVCCTFCGKSQTVVDKLVAAQCVSICNECIDLCNKIIAESNIKET